MWKEDVRYRSIGCSKILGQEAKRAPPVIQEKHDTLTDH
jgi:hypothetical protein